ncbi:MAG: FAD-dependent oxidoreductase [Sandaracinaceae bacterium]
MTRWLPVGPRRRRVRGCTRGTRAQADGDPRVAVVGGGLAGMAAACVLAERGVRVTVLEKEPFLGGRLGAWTERFPDGSPYEMERGFHGFFRQYYNLRNLIARVDPELRCLTPLEDYPILGPNGLEQSFRGLPRTPPLNLIAMLRRTELFRLADLRSVDSGEARQMMSFDPKRTYRDHDGRDARSYLDGLGFPPSARQMFFDVFSHSFFNPEEGLSAAEMLMMFHFYFLGNPEGLVFDVMNEPFRSALWAPMERYLEQRGAEVRTGATVTHLDRTDGGGWRLAVEGDAAVDTDGVVLAVTVPALQALTDASPGLRRDPAFVDAVGRLGVTLPFAVWRLFLDRAAEPQRHAFVGTTGFGHLDNISLYERFEGESRRWAEATGGSVVELHAYAWPGRDEEELRSQLHGALETLYPELAGARILHQSWLVRQDCPSFEPGSHAERPSVRTPYGNVVLAGDFVKLPFPTALMERAASSGMLAANHLLDRWDVRGETLYSVPLRGVMAALAG